GVSAFRGALRQSGSGSTFVSLPPKIGSSACTRGGRRMHTRAMVLPTDSRIDLTVHTLQAHVPEYEDDIEKVLISSEEIEDCLTRLGDEISADYRGEDLILVGVLKGAFVVMADLARRVRLPVEFDFMAVSSYGAATKTSGVVRILKDL